jgi:hypothetical protein
MREEVAKICTPMRVANLAVSQGCIEQSDPSFLIASKVMFTAFNYASYSALRLEAELEQKKSHND